MSSAVKPGRGRPRGFDPEQALEVGQQMFHAEGYDGVGLAALTETFGIKPPSFYSAFGSKAGFFERVLQRYSQTVLPLEPSLVPGRPVAEAFGDLLRRAARVYAAHPRCRGCLALEALRGSGEGAVLARAVVEQRRARMRAFVAVSHPGLEGVVVDFVGATMAGLSASAREGMDEARLGVVAEIAAGALVGILEGGGG